MPELGAPLPAAVSDAGLWLGLLITLLVFSLLFGDTVLARVAQHLLVGAGTGYAVLLAIQYVLSVRLLAPLARGEWLGMLPLLLLAGVLVVAGVERIIAQGGEQGPPAPPAGRMRQFLHALGAIPLALLLGVGFAAGVVGIVQGTILVQTWQAIDGAFGGANGAGIGFWAGVLTLLLTTATLLHLALNRRRQIEPLPRPLRDLLALWVWIGERALWIATGVLLARLFASRLTLLVDRVGWVAATVQATGLWQWLNIIWLNLVG